MVTNRRWESREDLDSSVKDHNEQIKREGEELETFANDVEIIREVTSKLHRSSTAEAADAIQDAIEYADHSASEAFAGVDESLEQQQADGQDFGRELQDTEGETQEDISELDRTSEQLHDTGARKHADAARDVAEEDLELLAQQRRDIEEELKVSEQHQQDQRSRVRR